VEKRNRGHDFTAPVITASSLSKGATANRLGDGDLVLSLPKVVTATLESIIRGEPLRRSRVGELRGANTQQSGIAIIGLNGPSAMLRELAESLAGLAGGWIPAFWLVLLGVWPGAPIQPLGRAKRGRPPISINLEYLAYAALETQLSSGCRPFTNEFYEATHARWEGMVNLHLGSISGHARLAGLDPTKYASAENVRKALKRLQRHMKSLLEVPNAPDTEDEERERHALEAASEQLKQMEWLR